MRPLFAGAATFAFLVGLGGCATPPTSLPPVAVQSVGLTEAPEAPTFDISKLDRIPVLKHAVGPKYPPELKRQGVEGFVLCDFVVTSQGNTRFAYTLLTNNPAFGDNTVAALKKWTFTPGSKGGRTVNTHMAVPLAFTLHPHGPWTDVINRLGDVFFPISKTWAHSHNVTAPADFAALPSRHPFFTIRIVADENGGLMCDPAGATRNQAPPELILFINQALAAHPIAPATLDLVRGMSGFYLQMPVFPARPSR